MTRINCVPPSELCRQHLVAEYRELPRIFALVKAAIERGERPDDKRNPVSYTLGRGHVRFFYNKLGWLVARQQSLVDEMIKRGYNPAHRNPDQLVEEFADEWLGDWEPDGPALALNRKRIAERLPSNARREKQALLQSLSGNS